jgi:Flp pilus assembly protein TadG
MRRITSWLHGQRGAAHVEFAVTSVLFFTLTFGIIEVSRLIYQYNIVASAARDGARYAIVRGLNSGRVAQGTQAMIQNHVRTRDVGRNSTVAVQWFPDNKEGSVVQVTVSQPFLSIVPYSMVSNMTVTSTSRMTILR